MLRSLIQNFQFQILTRWHRGFAFEPTGLCEAKTEAEEAESLDTHDVGTLWPTDIIASHGFKSPVKKIIDDRIFGGIPGRGGFEATLLDSKVSQEEVDLPPLR